MQVYTVGIGNIYLDELRFIASDPDINHVYLLSSFNDAPDFVDFLSITACDGKNYMQCNNTLYTVCVI